MGKDHIHLAVDEDTEPDERKYEIVAVYHHVGGQTFTRVLGRDVHILRMGTLNLHYAVVVDRSLRKARRKGRNMRIVTEERGLVVMDSLDIEFVQVHQLDRHGLPIAAAPGHNCHYCHAPVDHDEEEDCPRYPTAPQHTALPFTGEATVVTVPQINGGPTLVAFPVPAHLTFGRAEEWTFEEANAVKLGPPTVISPLEFPEDERPMFGDPYKDGQ